MTERESLAKSEGKVDQRGYDWTQTYERWQGWEDPDLATKRREEEAARLKRFRQNNMTCAHDRSAERRVMEMSIHEKLQACREFRHKGNRFHEEGQYRRAALQYRQALVYYDFCFTDKEEIQLELDETRQACLLNSAACFLRCDELGQVLDCCYQVLQEEPDNVKALYRRAVVFRRRDCFREAAADLSKALAQRPNDVMLRKESAILKSKMAAYRERSKAMGEQIFGAGRVMAVSEEEISVSHPDLSPPDSLVDMSTGAMPSTGLGGDYRVADGIGVEFRDGSITGDQEEGRRRHDLALPVYLDLSGLEKMAGCAWPVEA